MLNIIGHYSLIISLLIITFLLIEISYGKKDEILIKKSIIIGTSIYTLLILLSFISLIYAHILTDLSINNVYTSSHSAQPIIFKISGLWGNHEGSMLLWVLILCIYTYSLIFLQKVSHSYFKWVIANQLLFNFFFILYILCTSNPFILNNTPIYEGKELNPILQDIVLSIHPPLIYLGYIGLSIPFSLTISYLINKGEETHIWLKYVEKYNIVAWSFLTLGIFLGSWWAYYELGWGGWWFWDPVENASLLPWLLSTGLIHTIIASKKTRTLLTWTSILSILCFYSSILGTFFVRSGFLDSVHSFASDNKRGIFILIFLLFLILYLLYIYIYNYQFLKKNFIQNITSREGLIFLNQLFFVYIYIIVAIGTFYPTLYEYINDKSITIGPSFYNQAIIPVLIPFLLLMIISNYSIWKRDIVNKIEQGNTDLLYYICFLLSIIFYMSSTDYNGPYILYIMVVLLTWSIISTIIITKYNQYNSLQMRLGHIGFFIFILGITFWYSLNKEEHRIMYPGDSYVIDNYEYIFRGINILKGPNYDAFYGSYVVLKDGILISILFPEKRHYYVQDFYTSKVDIHSNFLYDLHVIIGDGNIYTGWATSIYIYPFMSWIWLGILLLILGSITSIYKKYKIKNNKIKTR